MVERGEEVRGTWVTSLSLIKHDGATVTTSATLSWLRDSTAADGLKQAIDWAAENKPGFAINDYLQSLIPELADNPDTPNG